MPDPVNAWTRTRCSCSGSDRRYVRFRSLTAINLFSLSASNLATRESGGEHILDKINVQYAKQDVRRISRHVRCRSARGFLHQAR
jgi:hypothetical protein